MTIELFVILLLVFTSSAFIKGWAGFGTNLIAMPILVAMLNLGLETGVTIVISVNIFLNITMLIENKKFNIKSLDNIKLLVLFGVTFTFIGAYFLKSPDNANLIKIIAGSAIVILSLYRIFTAVYEIKSKIKEDNVSRYFIPVGIISGFFNGIAGLGGIPALLLLSNTDMDKEKLKTTIVSYFLVMNVVAIIGYILVGNYTTFVITSILYMIVPSILFVLLGVYMSRRVSDKIFSRVMFGILLFMGTNLVVTGIVGKGIIQLLFT